MEGIELRILKIPPMFYSVISVLFFFLGSQSAERITISLSEPRSGVKRK